MRELYILIGAPGTGKTSWLRKHQLTDHAIGLDDIRALVAPRALDTAGHEVFSIRPKTNKLVVEMFHQAVISRLNDGETLFLDTTQPRNVTKLVDHAKTLGYEVTYIDFQRDMTDEQLVARQNPRFGTRSYVPEQDVIRIAGQVRRQIEGLRQQGNNIEIVEADNAALGELAAERVLRDHLLMTQEVDPTIERVLIVGDVQSCDAALRLAYEDLTMDRPNTKIIFVGDLCDRGPDAAGVFDIVLRLMSLAKNPTNNIELNLVQGNHDTHLRKALTGLLPQDQLADTHRSLRELQAIYRDATIARVLDAMTLMLPFRFGGRNWLVTHAGLGAEVIEAVLIESKLLGNLPSYYTMDISAEMCIRGTSERGLSYQGRCDYSLAGQAALKHSDVFQAFGHRNGGRAEQPTPLVCGSLSSRSLSSRPSTIFPLEARVEHGGRLRVLELLADGDIIAHEYEN